MKAETFEWLIERLALYERCIAALLKASPEAAKILSPEDRETLLRGFDGYTKIDTEQ